MAILVMLYVDSSYQNHSCSKDFFKMWNKYARLAFFFNQIFTFCLRVVEKKENYRTVALRM